MNRVAPLCVLLMCAVPAAAQSTGPATPQTAAVAATQTAPSDAKAPNSDSGMVGAGLLVLPLADASGQRTTAQGFPVSSKPAQPFQSQQGFQWADALKQYMMLLTWQHSMRLFQEKTHTELGGPFWSDYVESAQSLSGWSDGDSFTTNYVAHPIMGAVTGYIQVQNDPAGRSVEFGKSRAYWHSRGWALAAAAIYSTQFELGPMSEASIGNVGLNPGTMAYVDLVMTPVLGLGMIVAEDAIDRYLIARIERRLSRNQARLLRSLLNPNRSIANLLRIEWPWKRDTRDFVSREGRDLTMSVAPGRGGAVATR
jgi:hypothetical protein